MKSTGSTRVGRIGTRKEIPIDPMAQATTPENTYRHAWRTGDVVVWDNRAAVHRATPYDGAKYRRLMQRTTISMGAHQP